ncbi:MAG: hypothetical protein JWO30_1586 [Fibrobacteres bacterium]|nr:hypothetical protein [Fibrobacterota bacterium]
MEGKSPTQVQLRVFEYLDYRKFITDSHAAKKRVRPSFSLRFVAGRIGSTSGSLTRILKGQLNLNPAMAAKVARVFDLTEKESEYFETMVLFCHAKTLREQNLFLEKLLRMRGSKIRTLEEGQHQYFREWYFSAVRELLNFFPFDGNYQKLAKMLRPAITIQEAKDAVKLLLHLGLVEKDGAGKYRLTEKFVTSGENVRAIHVNNLNLSMGDLASRVLQSIPVLERDYSGLTLSLPAEGFREIREMIRLFRQEILEKVRKFDDADVVYRLNLQLFPLSIRHEQETP